MATSAQAPRPRPLSPHLTHWKWGVHMAVSILHRVTGQAMALGAVPLFLWWLAALATGEDAYRRWYDIASGPLGYIVGVGFTWTLFQHLANGVRHLVMDTGAGFEIGVNKVHSAATIVFSILMTAIVWAAIVLL